METQETPGGRPAGAGAGAGPGLLPGALNSPPCMYLSLYSLNEVAIIAFLYDPDCLLICPSCTTSFLLSSKNPSRVHCCMQAKG